jgi:hypothetical protein
MSAGCGRKEKCVGKSGERHEKLIAEVDAKRVEVGVSDRFRGDRRREGDAVQAGDDGVRVEQEAGARTSAQTECRIDPRTCGEQLIVQVLLPGDRRVEGDVSLEHDAAQRKERRESRPHNDLFGDEPGDAFGATAAKDPDAERVEEFVELASGEEKKQLFPGRYIAIQRRPREPGRCGDLIEGEVGTDLVEPPRHGIEESGSPHRLRFARSRPQHDPMLTDDASVNYLALLELSTDSWFPIS